MKALVGAGVIAFALLTPRGPAAAQSSAASAKAASKNPQGTFTVELVKALDSRKVHEGDEVEAKLTGGITLPDGTSHPRDARVLGHVTEAKARSKGAAESSLEIVFDTLVGPGGAKTAIHGAVLAAAPNPNPQTGGPDAAGNIYTHLDASTTAAVANDQRAVSVPMLNDTSRGALGIEDLNLKPDGIFTSGGKEVKLRSGIRLLLSVTLQ
jgi:hypothetical protein